MEELRHGTRIHNPCFLPDNTYGNRPLVKIEQDLEAQEFPCPTNEDDDLGTMYSANFWRKIIASAALVINIPQQYWDIFKLPHTEQKLWKTAMNDEIKSLDERKVWDLVALPPGRILIKGRWVYTIKSDGRKKACFVAKGFTQIFRIDFEEIFSLVARFETV